MELRDLLRKIKFSGNIEDCVIENITHDSRKVKPGTLFVAIKGFNDDGHNYILDAVDRGASAVMSNGRSLTNIGVPVIQVDDPRKSMSKIAAVFYQHPTKDIKITAVTGTNGKTSVTNIINHIYKTADISCGSLGTLGFSTPSGMISTGFTTPESVDLHQLFSTMLQGGINHAIMEISSHALDLHRVDDVDVDVAIFTNLTNEHLDYHGNMENYFNAKLKLFQSLSEDKTSIINMDDPFGRRIKQSINTKIITYSFSKNADLYPNTISLSMDGIQAELKFGSEVINIQSNLIGKYNLSNIMAAVSAALVQGVPIPMIEEAIKSMPPISGRLERINSDNPGNILIDYAHTPDAYQQVISMFRDLNPPGTKIITFFGCGGNRDVLKRPIMGQIASNLSDEIIITSDNPRFENVELICEDIARGITKDNYTIILNRKKALEHALTKMDDSTLLLLLGKGREEYEIIDDEKIFHSDLDIIADFHS
jgi:UDP-N-acetylmuramoyl-L-alanyl-D-glutamate--2,6-diaminopimelate ligase